MASIQSMVSHFVCFYTFHDLNKIILMKIQSNIVWDSLAVRSCILCTFIFNVFFQFIFFLLFIFRMLNAYELDKNYLKFFIQKKKTFFDFDYSTLFKFDSKPIHWVDD